MRIGIDLDGVLADFVGGVIEHFGLDVEYRDITHYGKIVEAAGFNSVDGLLCYLLETKSSFFRGLEADTEGVSTVNALAADGHTIVVITSRPDSQYENTGIWLRRHGVTYHELHVTDDKTDVKRCDAYLDDAPHHLLALESAHGEHSKVVKWTQPWNAGGMYASWRASTWDTFAALVDIWADEESARVDVPLATRDDDEEVRVTDPVTGGEKGEKLAQLGAIEPRALLELAKVAGHGTRKYSRYNFLKGYRWSLSYDALERHLLAFWAGEDRDDKSGLYHLAHAAWHCLALLAFSIYGRGTDDRWKPEQEEAA